MLGRHANKAGSVECPNCEGLKESAVHIWLGVHHMLLEGKLFEDLKQVLFPEVCNTFLRNSVFDKALLHLWSNEMNVN